MGLRLGLLIERPPRDKHAIESFVPREIGSISNVKEMLQRAIGVKWSSTRNWNSPDEERGLTTSEACVFDFRLLPPVNIIFLNVSGEGNPVSFLKQLSSATGLFVVDENYSLIDLDKPTIDAWEAYQLSPKRTKRKSRRPEDDL